MKGIIHFHSRCSYDSLLSPAAILETAAKERLDFMVLTDHDSIDGSVALREEAEKGRMRLTIPRAAEYRTELGDMIAAFILEEVRFTSFDTFVENVRRQGGLILLPHPYDNHREIERCAAAADLIETYNGRLSSLENGRAAELAASLSKKGYGSSDAHLKRDLGNVILECTGEGDLREIILSGKIRSQRQIPTPYLSAVLSQYIKSFRQRDALRAIRTTYRCARKVFQHS